MILVDTSIWIDHFHKTDKELVNLLHAGLVCIHPFVIGELACGNLSNRSEIFNLLQALPRIERAFDDEIYTFIEDQKLYGIGLGFVDAHLLAAALIHNVRLWTRDKTLKRVAVELKINQ